MAVKGKNEISKGMIFWTMSSKKKKTNVLWVSCDSCGVCVHERDLKTHENDCPPTNAKNYPYIRNNILSCSLGKVNKKDLNSHLPEDCLDSLIFLSNAALQIANIPIGRWVSISWGPGCNLIRKAWKEHDRQFFTAALYEKDLCCQPGESELVSIRLLEGPVEVAETIYWEGSKDLTQEEIVFFQQRYVGRVIKQGDSIDFSIYGRIETIKIEHVIPLNGKENGLFKVVLETKWVPSKTRIEMETPKLNFAGYHAAVEEISDIFDSVFLDTVKKGSIKTRGILIHGSTGTGKSLLTKKFAEQYTTIHLTNAPISSQSFDHLHAVIERALRGQPAVVIVDDIDGIFGKLTGGSDNQEAFSLAAQFDRLHSLDAKVILLATATNVNEVSRCLRRPGRFDKEIEIGAPTPQERREIMEVLLPQGHTVPNDVLKAISDSAHGFVGADLAALVSKANTLAMKTKRKIDAECLRSCFPLIRPSAMREITLQVPDVRWEDVGGQTDLKHQLRQAVEWPLKYPESFKRLGISPPRGLLMYGPPGCSKTMIAKALATESGLNFFSVKGPELFSCWVGDSEKAVREVFRRARQASPSIVFFDELDALAGERTGSLSGGSQVQERVLAQLLTELDGVEALGDVIVVGATNRPDRIDPALLRPGRLDRVVYVPLPNPETRAAIFRIQFRKTPVAADVDVSELVAKTEGYSGAEVVAVCREAAMDALSLNIESKCVNKSNFLKALDVVLPRTSRAALLLCENYKDLRLN